MNNMQNPHIKLNRQQVGLVTYTCSCDFVSAGEIPLTASSWKTLQAICVNGTLLRGEMLT
jgi:hypothetical protein